MRLTILYIGKPRDPHANAIARDFLGRASHYARCDMREIRPDRYDPFAKHSGAVKVLLDPAGRPAGSHCFTGLIRQWEMEDREVVFLVGGHDGFPGEWKSKAGLLLSLSPMTFPHELARALLCEQIYRAFTTLRGHPYPR